MAKKTAKPERNYGIELFRVFSMLMIVILHINLKGGLMGCFTEVNGNYAALWFGETLCFASVNCYALISGYVMYSHRATAGKLLNTWAQVFSISALTGLFFLIFKDSDIPMDKIKDAFQPLTHAQYWYFVAYFGMYMLIPMLNAAVAGLSRDAHKKLCFLIFIFFTIMPITFKNDFFRTGNGMSTLWLSLMYIVGAYFGKYGIDRERYSPLFCGVCGFCCGLLLTIIVVYHSYKVGLETGTVSGQFDYLFYTNPLTVLEAIMFLMCFSQLKFKGETVKAAIKWLASSSFSVYLIHVQPIIFDCRFSGKFRFLSEYSPIVMTLLVIIWAIIIYVGCTVLDKIRLLAFKLLHINEGMTLLGEKLNRVFTAILSKL